MKKLMLLYVGIMLWSVALAHSTTINFQPHFVGYWQNFDNHAKTSVRLTDIPSGYNVVIIAFADLAKDGTVSFNLEGPPYHAESQLPKFIQDIKALQERGTKVLLSLGGEDGVFYVNSAQAEQKFVSSLEAVISKLGVDGVDYDFENGLTTANAPYLLQATQQMKVDFKQQGKDLMVTLAPEAITVYWKIFPHGNYDTLIRSGLVNWVQVQLYNAGCMLGSKPGGVCFASGTEDLAVSQADSTIQAWKKAGMVNPSTRYVLGFAASTGAAGSGYMNPAVIQKALTCLKTGTQCDTYTPTPEHGYQHFGGIMTWSINWDAKNGYAFVHGLSR